ncbi:hypothetical protein FNV68_01025 [Streptomyces sp. S1D4-23]|nr:hypothetical protein FNV68_01025 [Streptomyces sp. S1D4-23]
MQERQWIAARRSELDALADELAKQLQEVQAERDELAIAERVLNRGRGVGPGRARAPLLRLNALPRFCGHVPPGRHPAPAAWLHPSRSPGRSPS